MTKVITAQNRYAKASFDDFGDNVIIKYCRQWVFDPQKLVAPMLMGDAGVGKTHLLWAMYHELKLCGFNKNVKLETDIEMIYNIRNGIANNNSDTILDEYKSSGILLLDDLCARRDPNGWATEQFLLIMDYRWRYNLPIAITTNYSIDKLSEILGDRILSRVMGMTKLFIMAGRDRRLESVL